MEYTQITLNDWMDMKKELDREFLGVKRGFVKIGFLLRQIDDQRLYENEGCKSVAEFAQKRYGLKQSAVSRFMSINKEYSVDGYSKTLRKEFEDFNRGQLEEMLKLTEQDRQMIQKETHRDDIRQLIEKFYDDNPDVLNEVFSAPEFDGQTIKQFAEIVNPGGNRSYRKGTFFMMMYENRIAVKKFGSNPQDMTWMEFYLITRDILSEMAAGSKTQEECFGKEENAPAHKSEEVQETKASNESGTEESYTEPDNGAEQGSVPEEENSIMGEPEMVKDIEESETVSEEAPEDDTVSEVDNQEAIEGAAEPEGEKAQEEYAPAHKSEEIPKEAEKDSGPETVQQADIEPEEEAIVAPEAAKSEDAADDIKPEMAAVTEEEIPGQMELTKDFPEYCPEETRNAEPEAVREAYTCRLLYMASKDMEEASAYMAEAMEGKIRKMKNVSFGVLTKPAFWEEFFHTEVDEEGREIECA